MKVFASQFSATIRSRRFITVAMLMVAVFVMVSPSFAQTTTAPTLEFDVTPLFDAMNDYIPLFMTVLGIAGGIAAASALVSMVLRQIVNAFSGRMG